MGYAIVILVLAVIVLSAIALSLVEAIVDYDGDE